MDYLYFKSLVDVPTNSLIQAHTYLHMSVKEEQRSSLSMTAAS